MNREETTLPPLSDTVDPWIDSKEWKNRFELFLLRKALKNQSEATMAPDNWRDVGRMDFSRAVIEKTNAWMCLENVRAVQAEEQDKTLKTMSEDLERAQLELKTQGEAFTKMARDLAALRQKETAEWQEERDMLSETVMKYVKSLVYKNRVAQQHADLKTEDQNAETPPLKKLLPFDGFLTDAKRLVLENGELNAELGDTKSFLENIRRQIRESASSKPILVNGVDTCLNVAEFVVSDGEKEHHFTSMNDLESVLSQLGSDILNMRKELGQNHDCNTRLSRQLKQSKGETEQLRRELDKLRHERNESTPEKMSSEIGKQKDVPSLLHEGKVYVSRDQLCFPSKSTISIKDARKIPFYDGPGLSYNGKFFIDARKVSSRLGEHTQSLFERLALETLNALGGNRIPEYVIVESHKFMVWPVGSNEATTHLPIPRSLHGTIFGMSPLMNHEIDADFAVKFNSATKNTTYHIARLPETNVTALVSRARSTQ